MALLLLQAHPSLSIPQYSYFFFWLFVRSMLRRHPGPGAAGVLRGGVLAAPCMTPVVLLAVSYAARSLRSLSDWGVGLGGSVARAALPSPRRFTLPAMTRGVARCDSA